MVVYKIWTGLKTAVYKICTVPLPINGPRPVQIFYTVVQYISRMQSKKPFQRRSQPDREGSKGALLGKVLYFDNFLMNALG